ncbi:MAG: hypothetical protein WB678_08015, partial [Stellaceae bacterium]
MSVGPEPGGRDELAGGDGSNRLRRAELIGRRRPEALDVERAAGEDLTLCVEAIHHPPLAPQIGAAEADRDLLRLRRQKAAGNHPAIDRMVERHFDDRRPIRGGNASAGHLHRKGGSVMVGVPTLIGMGQNRRRMLAPQAFGHSSGEPGELEIG